jgi:hypothetical protein
MPSLSWHLKEVELLSAFVATALAEGTTSSPGMVFTGIGSHELVTLALSGVSVTGTLFSLLSFEVTLDEHNGHRS